MTTTATTTGSKNTFKIGASFEFAGFECIPYASNNNPEDFGLDIYEKGENGEYICTCPWLTKETISIPALNKEFKTQNISIDAWEHENLAAFGPNWRCLYNGL